MTAGGEPGPAGRSSDGIVAPARTRSPRRGCGAGLAIRRVRHGGVRVDPGLSEPELTGDTVAPLVPVAGLLLRALDRASTGLRRLALAAIGAAVAKVCVVDPSGLTGLMRVSSFRAPGLVLAGLARLDRRATLRAQPRSGPTPPPGV